MWRNELGGLTFAIEAPGGRRFAKWAPPDSAIDLEREGERLAWAAAFAAVPTVLACGTDRDGGWLLTAGLEGESAVSQRWLRDPATAVSAIGAGLRALHDALPVAGCPFSWSAEERLALARAVAPSRGTPPTVMARLAEIPPVDVLVVCHGDACAPNTLLTADGRWSGHVDLGSLGIADRWADLAVATWSTAWNYGPGWEEPLLTAYGVEPDPARTAYYRLLWDAGP